MHGVAGRFSAVSVTGVILRRQVGALWGHPAADDVQRACFTALRNLRSARFGHIARIQAVRAKPSLCIGIPQTILVA